MKTRSATRRTAQSHSVNDSGTSRFYRYMESFAHNQGNPRMGFYPGLSSCAWHDPTRFPIVRALEEKYDEIRREIAAINSTEFHRESEEIGRTGSWSVLLLFERGRKNTNNCLKCPLVARLIAEHSAVRTLAGLTYVSKMSPGAQIAAHHGPTNIRVRCHLGIRVPLGDCCLRVGDTTRVWEQGKCLVFNDYLDHEAWNRTANSRTVLVVDLWHPDLTPKEVDLLQGLHRYASAQAESMNRYWTANASVG